jgi:hypothetical protein
MVTIAEEFQERYKAFTDNQDRLRYEIALGPLLIDISAASVESFKLESWGNVRVFSDGSALVVSWIESEIPLQTSRLRMFVLAAAQLKGARARFET